MTNGKPTVSVKVKTTKGNKRRSNRGGKVTVRVKQSKPRSRSGGRKKATNNRPKVTVTRIKDTGSVRSKTGSRDWAVATRKFGPTLGSGSSGIVRKYVMQALLPYNCVPSRILEDTHTNDDPTAVTSNFEYHDINLTNIMAVIPQPLSFDNIPSCGTLPGGYKLWGDLTKGVPIVSIMDSRLLAIVPERSPYGYPRTVPCTYRAKTYMNAIQQAPGQFVAAASNESLGYLTTPDQFRFLDPDVLWLDFCDLEPVKYETGFEAIYGPIHPALDADNSRYFWVDAVSSEGNHVAHDNVASVIEVTFVPRTGLSVDQMSTTQANTMKLVVERLSTTSMDADQVLLMADFEDQAPDHLTRAGVPIQTSGYYRVGLKGLLNDTLMNLAIGRFIDDITINYHLCRRINVASRHIVNTNCVLVSDFNSHVMQVKEQCLSASMLISNATPEAARGGRVYASTLPNGSSWTQLTSDLTKLRASTQNANRKFTGDLSTGVYGWLHSQNYGFRPFNDVIGFTDSGSQGCLRSYSLTQKTTTPNSQLRGCNVYYLQPPVISTSSASFGDTIMTLQMAVNFEYTTQSLIPVTAPVMLNSQAMMEMKNILMLAPTFTENPLHLSDFKKIAEAAGNFYKSNRGKFQAAFGAMASFGNPVLKALGLAANALDGALLQ